MEIFIYMHDFILFRIYYEANIFEKNDIVNMKTKSLMLFCYYINSIVCRPDCWNLFRWSEYSFAMEENLKKSVTNL